MKTIVSIQVLRGIAVSMVVLYHTYAVQQKYFGSNQLPDIFSLGFWGVDIFFVVSGFVMYKSVYRQRSKDSPLSFLMARVTRIYPAYWVVTLVIFAAAQFSPTLINSSYEGTPSLLRSLLLFPDHTLPWLNVGWSLIYEMWFYLLLFFLLALGRRAMPLILAIYAGLLVATGGIDDRGPTVELISDPLVLEFLSGFLIGSVYFNTEDHRRQGFLFCISLVAIVPIVHLMGTASINVPESLERFSTFGLLAASITAVALLIDGAIERTMLLQPVVAIGEASYSIYLTHVIALNLFYLASSRIVDIQPPAALMAIFCFGFVAFFGNLYYRCVETPLTRAAQNLVERSSPSTVP